MVSPYLVILIYKWIKLPIKRYRVTNEYESRSNYMLSQKTQLKKRGWKWKDGKIFNGNSKLKREGLFLEKIDYSQTLVQETRTLCNDRRVILSGRYESYK